MTGVCLFKGECHLALVLLCLFVCLFRHEQPGVCNLSLVPFLNDDNLHGFSELIDVDGGDGGCGGRGGGGCVGGSMGCPVAAPKLPVSV